MKFVIPILFHNKGKSVASSRIAATLLTEGRTAHSVFKLLNKVNWQGLGFKYNFKIKLYITIV